MDYNRFLNYYGQNMQPPVIREIMRYVPPNVDKSAAAGCPNPCVFPIRSATFDMKDGTQIHIAGKDIEDAQQSGATDGYEPLVNLLYKMQCEEHHPPTACQGMGPSQMKLIMSPGAQMALSTILLMCAQDDVPFLMDIPSFSIVSAPSVISLARQVIGVEKDAEGTSASSLRKVLSKWTPQDAQNPKSGIPRVLFLNPTCNNPTGVTTSTKRRKEIYAIAQEYNLMIVEDEPYYYIQEQKPRIPSYLSLDVDGRVLRIDSFSKIIAPGCAYVTGPQEVVTKMEYAFMQTIQQASALSQVLLYKLLKNWGPTGFEEQLQKIISFLRGRRLYALAMADKWLKGLAEWDVPTGGMFIRFTIYGTRLTSREINSKLQEDYVCLVPVSEFYPADAQLKDVAMLRYSVAVASDEAMEKAMKALASVIQDARSRVLNGRV